MPDFSPADIDIAARTAYGEAPDPAGQAAVAHVMVNRLASGKFGKSLSEIALARNQFETWDRKARELNSMPTNSPAYQQALAAVQGVVNGDIPDPTGGAT